MFEGTLVESRGLAVSRAQRWSTVGSAAVQLTLGTLIVLLPLMRPQTMKILTAAQHLTVPLLPVRPQPPAQVNTSNTSVAGPHAPSAPAQAPSGARVFPSTPGTPIEDGPPDPIGPIAMGTPGSLPLVGSGTAVPAVTVAHAVSIRPVTLSGGVSAGMLLSPIRPTYPQIAILTKTQGAVVVEAVISRTGKIESAQVTSGPPMLRQAALDAVAAARYRPYLLSGEPVEVQTTVTVIFRLGE